MKTEELYLEQKNETEEIPFPEKPELPQWVLFGDEWIEFDKSMAQSGLCPECEQLGYCKRDGKKLTNDIDE